MSKSSSDRNVQKQERIDRLQASLKIARKALTELSSFEVAQEALKKIDTRMMKR